MSSRISPFVNEGFYHTFNRGVAKQPTFIIDSDYRQALFTMRYYQTIKPVVKLSRYKSLSKSDQNRILSSLVLQPKLVDIVSYVLMPNHWHFLLRQNVNNGITIFLSRFTNSYTRYYNTRHNRVGHLFQGVFKSVEIESEEQLLHVSRYIHLNPLVSSLIYKSHLITYPWSSFPEFISGNSAITNLDYVLHRFGDKFNYENFVLNHSDYARELELIKHATIDLE